MLNAPPSHARAPSIRAAMGCETPLMSLLPLRAKEPTRNRAKTPFDSFVVALVFVQTEAVRSLV